MSDNTDQTRSAVLYRMVLPDHTCPFGVAARDMLNEAGYEIDEHILSSREEVDAYKTRESVATTPQVFIAGKRIGGAEALQQWLAENG